MQFFAVLLSTVSLALSTIATPLNVAERSELVSEPTYILPKEGTVWQIPYTEWVCWTLPVAPAPGTMGTIYIGNLTENGTPMLNLNIPLAENFPLSDGPGCKFVELDANMVPGDNKIVALIATEIGDSGHYAGPFTLLPKSD